MKIITVIIFFSLFPFVVHSACGLIPGTYPIYSESKIKLEKQILVNGNKVDKKKEYKPQVAIDINGKVSTNINLTLPSLSPSSFPSNKSKTDLKLKKDTTINHSSEFFYDDIKIDEKGITVDFTGGGPFHIDKLEVKKQATLNFSAGTYFIDELKLDDKNIILNISSGPVIFHIKDEFKIDDKDIKVNTTKGVADFIVYLHSGAKFKNKGDNLDFTGLIYGPSNIDEIEIEGKNSSFHGAIIVSGGEIKIKKEGIAFTYTTSDQNAVNKISSCGNTPPSVFPSPIANWHMDEASWNGSTNEVVDSSGNNHSGIAINGANTSQPTPAISGDPGTCGYGDFNGKTYVQIADNSQLDISDELTVTTWVYPNSFPRSGLKTIVSKDTNFEFHINSRGQLFWWWGGGSRALTTSTAITVNKWTHVAIVYSDNNNEASIYINGVLSASKSISGALRLNNLPLQIGADQGISSRLFDGKIDEVALFNQALNKAEILHQMNSTHPCPAIPPCATKNLALDGQASQSSTWRNAAYSLPKNVIDNNTRGAWNYNANSLNHTNKDLKAWWQVKLAEDSFLDHIVLWNRTDCCSTRLSNFTVFVLDNTGNTVWSKVYYSGGGTFNPSITIKLPSNTIGRTVKVQLNGRNYLHLAEVQVFGYPNNASCGGGGGDTPATNFNCVEQGANAITGKLYTKTTAQSLSFDVLALRDANTLENNFANGADHTVSIELVDASSGSCSTYNALNPAILQNLPFSSADAGKITANLNPSVTSSAYKKVKCRVIDKTDTTDIVTGCSTDSFAIRPTTFSVSSTSLASTASPTATSASTTKAGAFFDLVFTGYDDNPNQIDNSLVTAHPGASLAGTLTGTRSGAATDSPFTGNFNYSDVGWFLLSENTIYDDKFTELSGDEGAGDCLINSFENDPAKDSTGKNRIGCNFGNTATTSYFGRFTPDHFKVTASTAGIFSNACTGFTYNGQTFNYQTAPTLTVTAYNALSPAAVTFNYKGVYADHLTATDFNVTTPTTDSSQLGADGSTLVNLLWTPDSAALADNNNGSLTFSFGNDSFNYLHQDNSKIAPFTPTVDFIFTDITDSDGIQTQSLPQTLQSSASSIRFGRLNLANTHGSELSNLAVPLFTEYFNGSHFVTNIEDTCTSLSVNQLSFNGNPSPATIGSGSTTASISNTPLILGQSGLSLTAPGAGNTGYVDIGTTTFISSSLWLAYDWDNDGSHDNSPSSRATFGIYKGNSKQIYLREVY